MKLSLNRTELSDALAVASAVVPARTPNPILQSILISVQKDFAHVQATDLEIGVQLGIGQVEVEKPGSIVVTADKLVQIVRESKDETLSLEVVKDVCHIRGKDSHFQIFGQDPKSFPPVAEFDGNADFEIETEALRSLADWTVFAAARENTRYAINGVLWDKKGAKLTLVATDGRRLSKAEHSVGVSSDDMTAIVPTKGMNLFNRVLTEPGTSVSIKISSNRILLKSARATVDAALLEGHFPKYEDVIPSDCEKKVEFDTQELLSAVRRAALLTNEESKGVRLAFSDNALTVSSRAPEQGEAVINVPVDYDGEAVEIGFNPLFLTDALRAVPTESVTFEFLRAERPGVIRFGDANLYVVMPVSLN